MCTCTLNIIIPISTPHYSGISPLPTGIIHCPSLTIMKQVALVDTESAYIPTGKEWMIWQQLGKCIFTMQVNNSHEEYQVSEQCGVTDQWFSVGGSFRHNFPLKMVACHRNALTYVYSHCLQNRQNDPSRWRFKAWPSAHLHSRKI